MNITLFGGSGFVGHAIAAQLANAGHSVVIPTRKREHAKVAAMLPNVRVEETKSLDEATLTRLISGADAVINLVGILHERKAGDFEQVYCALTQRILSACNAAGVKRYLHMSALGAATDGPSNYQQARGRAEAIVRQSNVQWTLFAPSVIFGQGDSFLTMFGKVLSALPPFLPMVMPRAGARFQPVWVQDVARAFVAALTSAETIGQRYELVGPDVMTLRELVQHVSARFGRSPMVISTPPPFSTLQAFALEFAPGGPIMSRDNLRSMSVDSVSSEAWPAFIGQPAAKLAAITPTYLGDLTDAYARYRKT